MIDEITYVVGDIASRIDNTIYGVTDSLTGKVETCDSKWLRNGKTIIDTGGFEYLVSEMEYNEDFMAAPLGHVNVFNGLGFIPSPLYINGTKLSANAEWSKLTKNVTSKTPLIWLLEVIRERQYGRGDSRDFTADLRIFFLDETNVKDYYAADHRREVVYPMKQLAKAFLEVITKDRSFETVEEVEYLSFSRFGVEQQNGMFQNILDANLSGVEMRLTLTKRKQNCKC